LATGPPRPPSQPDLEVVARQICAAEKLAFVKRAGTGTFKETFEVQSGNSPLALKIYRPGQSLDRPTREIEALTRCNHPNIARLIKIAGYQSGTDTFAYCLEEFVPGGTLTTRLALGVYSRADVDTLAVPLLDAVGHVAGLNLVHRDIKPDNVLLRSDGVTPVVVDFGLVRDLSAVSITPTWQMHGPGTPLYAPPEQLLNAKALIDWRADQFSAGVLLSYAVFGFHPYEEPGDSHAAIVSRVMARAGATQRFKDAVRREDLPALLTMTEPWPYQRFRKAPDLLQAWRAQRGTP
jgi:serine/threonine protein kinase